MSSKIHNLIHDMKAIDDKIARLEHRRAELSKRVDSLRAAEAARQTALEGRYQRTSSEHGQRNTGDIHTPSGTTEQVVSGGKFKTCVNDHYSLVVEALELRLHLNPFSTIEDYWRVLPSVVRGDLQLCEVEAEFRELLRTIGVSL